MKNHYKSYALGILFGLLFYLPGFLEFNWSLQKHWLAMLIFAPALAYIFYIFGNFITKPIKENSWYLLTFIFGVVLCVIALFSLESSL
ncbi:MAG: hypothetical protein ABS939_18760 [Psychrobacillus sp.]